MSPIAADLLGIADIISTIIKTLERSRYKQLEKAKKEYWEIPRDFTSPFEQNRQKILVSLTELQTEVMLSVSNQAMVLRITTLIYDYTILSYEAVTEQELKIVELGIGQIKGTLEQYRQIMRKRSNARWLALVVSVIALIGLGALIFWATLPNSPSVNSKLPIIEIPLPVIIWSAIGSFSAILYRFNKSGDVELQDPFRWLFTRPITGIVMGTITYLALKVGILPIAPDKVSSLGNIEVVWLIAFIGGFSDRFADSLLKTLVGRFGGNKEDELVNTEDIPSLKISSLDALVENLNIFKRLSGEKPTTLKDAFLEDNDSQEEIDSEDAGNKNLSSDDTKKSSTSRSEGEKS